MLSKSQSKNILLLKSVPAYGLVLWKPSVVQSIFIVSLKESISVQNSIEKSYLENYVSSQNLTFH